MRGVYMLSAAGLCVCIGANEAAIIAAAAVTAAIVALVWIIGRKLRPVSPVPEPDTTSEAGAILNAMASGKRAVMAAMPETDDLR